MSMSRVPWTRSLGLSGIKPSSPWLPRGSIHLSYWLSRGEVGPRPIGGHHRGLDRSLPSRTSSTACPYQGQPRLQATPLASFADVQGSSFVLVQPEMERGALSVSE